MICDGIEKYKKNLATIGQEGPMQVSLQEANESGYDKVIWIHAQYTPQEPGIELIAKSLGIDKSKICVPDARTAQELLTTQQIPESLSKDLEGDTKPLLVCMAGKTSLMAAKVLATKGVMTDSLIGGITELPEGKTKQLSELIRQA
jgi:rhodanese-related sulfurtransferase